MFVTNPFCDSVGTDAPAPVAQAHDRCTGFSEKPERENFAQKRALVRGNALFHDLFWLYQPANHDF
jgi:hypothetical protein